MTLCAGIPRVRLIGAIRGSVPVSLALFAFAMILAPAQHVSAQSATAPAALPTVDVSGAVSETVVHTVTLPLVVAWDSLWTDAPIWLDALAPGAPQVVLFRRTFFLDRARDAATLLSLNGVTIWDHGQPLAPGVSSTDNAIHVMLEAADDFLFEAQCDCGG